MTNRPSKKLKAEDDCRSNSSGEEGNSRPPPQISPSKNWCFTWNNYNSSIVPKFQTLLDFNGKYIFQEEVGDEGTPHLQGYIEFKEKVRPVSRIPAKEYPIHWEKAKGNKTQNQLYCTKLSTGKGKVYTNMKAVAKPLKDPLEGKELYPWQKEVIAICDQEPDDRTIYWYWEPDGATGKTALAKHLCIHYDALMLSGKAADIKYGVSQWQEKGKNTHVFVFNITRTKEDFVSYEALESVKDGIFFNGKYESGMCMFNPPHIFVFANFEPKYEAMSKDRWKVVRIGAAPLTEPRLPAAADAKQKKVDKEYEQYMLAAKWYPSELIRKYGL